MAEVNIHLEEEEKKYNGALLHKAEIKKKVLIHFYTR